MSLKSNLNQIIRDRNGGVVSIDEIAAYCKKASYKLSNAERRLRRSDSPDIEPVYNPKKTAIVGYRARQTGSGSQEFAITAPKLGEPKTIAGYVNQPLKNENYPNKRHRLGTLGF